MGLEQQNHQENAEQKQEPSTLDSLVQWAKESSDYARALILGDKETVAEHHIKNNEKFDDEEAMEVASTGNLDSIARYLESGKEGTLSDETMLSLNDIARQRTSPYENIGAEDFKTATRLFKILNRNPKVAESNTNHYLELIRNIENNLSDPDSHAKRTLSIAPAYLAGLENAPYLKDPKTGEDRVLVSEAFYANPELFSRTYPAVEPPYGSEAIQAQAINELTARIQGVGLLQVATSGDLDKIIDLLNATRISKEQRAQIGDAIAHIHFGQKAQEKELESAGPATELMLTVTKNNNMPYLQFIAIVENFYGPNVTHGYMPEEVRTVITERRDNLKKREEHDESARLDKVLMEFGRENPQDNT